MKRKKKAAPRLKTVVVHRFAGLSRAIAALHLARLELQGATAQINGQLALEGQVSRKRHTAIRTRLEALEASVRRLEWPVDPPRVAVRGDFINDEVSDAAVIGSAPADLSGLESAG
jgi:hypothetical protein